MQLPGPRLVQRWHDVIDEAADLERGYVAREAGRRRSSGVFWGMAVAAALVLGIGIGLNKSSVSEQSQPQINTSAFTRGLQAHFRDSRAQLTALGTSDDRILLVRRMIDQNRLFGVAAERNNAPQLARVLRAIEPLLLQLAAENVAPEETELLRAQLRFELRVMLTKITRETSEGMHST
jgi:hypothetical protein